MEIRYLIAHLLRKVMAIHRHTMINRAVMKYAAKMGEDVCTLKL